MKKLLLFFIVIFSLAGMSRVETLPQPKEWTVDDSKLYARESLLAWQHNQWLCLDNLWTKESNWRHEAYNNVKIMGKNAGGIPQILGLSPNTNPTEQIDRGLDYISYRYGTPCKAWRFWQKNGWY
jgi:tRNA(Met) C34 N-acetyltransferase TmcA